MPIYEFGCAKCGNEFEELVMNKKSQPVCPKCGSTDTHKLMSAPARSTKSADGAVSSGGGCGGCSGGNCASCGR